MSLVFLICLVCRRVLRLRSLPVSSAWAYPKELRQLTHKAIDIYLSDDKKKQGKLRQGYEIAKDPSSWEAEQAEKDAAKLEAAQQQPEEDVDMLEDDAADGKAAGAKKRKRAAGDKEPKAKKEPASKAKKEPAAKKRKVRCSKR